MKPNFDLALKHTLGVEGDFSDHPADRGGATRYGVTEAVARKHGYRGAMKDFPIETAKRIYMRDYWAPFDFDEFPDHRIAAYLFDMAVNHGGGGMARIAQRAASYRTTLAIDGRWGPQTRNTLIGLARKSPENLLGALKGERWRTFLAIAEARPSQRAFLWGWARRCA